MSMIDHFAPTLRQEGFFQEWARFIRTKSPGDALGSVVLEALRDAVNDGRRSSFVYFMTFMRTRTWAEAGLDLEEHFDERDRAVLKGATAQQVYDRMRTLVEAQLEDYHHQLLLDQSARRKEERGLIESDPFEKIEAKISMLVETKVQALLEPFGKQIMEEFKKHMDQGEGWKDSGEPKA